MFHKNPLRGISLFSGAGGMDLGLESAGFNIIACIEKDLNACETLRYNYSKCNKNILIIEDDIKNIDPQELMKNLNIQPYELDILFGGPPCQAFSQIGKRLSLQDERGLLLFEIIRFAESLMPKAILIEQVKGLLQIHDENGKQGAVFNKLINDLESIGYSINWKVINSVDYGVPQKREILFIVALRDSVLFNFPLPTHSSTSNSISMFSSKSHVTVGEVLANLPVPASKGSTIPENSHIDVTPIGDRSRICGVPEGSHLSACMHLPIEQRKNLTKKDTTKFRRLSRNEPSLTLRCGEIFYHPTEDRYLTPRECLRIHGYPDTFILRGPVRGRSGQVKNLDQHRLVANSVPPPIAYILANSIKEVIHAEDI